MDIIEKAQQRYAELAEVVENAKRARSEMALLKEFMRQARSLFPEEFPAPTEVKEDQRAQPPDSTYSTSSMAEYVLKVYGPRLHINEILAKMRVEKWSGTEMPPRTKRRCTTGCPLRKTDLRMWGETSGNSQKLKRPASNVFEAKPAGRLRLNGATQ